jgi:hypothetical protein
MYGAAPTTRLGSIPLLTLAAFPLRTRNQLLPMRQPIFGVFLLQVLPLPMGG